MKYVYNYIYYIIVIIQNIIIERSSVPQYNGIVNIYLVLDRYSIHQHFPIYVYDIIILTLLLSYQYISLLIYHIILSIYC